MKPVATHPIPPSWTLVRGILAGDRHESRRLLLCLMNQVDAGETTLSKLGINTMDATEEVTVLCKLEGIALYAMVSERYGLPFGLDEQAKAFLSNPDLQALTVDLGIHVQRADLPWVMDVVALDREMREMFELPEEVLPLDILFAVASRCREWYEDAVGTASEQGGCPSLRQEDVVKIMRETLVGAYDSLAVELETGAEEGLAFDVVRASLGVQA